jgi:hypothetical protein
MPEIYEQVEVVDDFSPFDLEYGNIVKFEDGTLYQVNDDGKLVPPEDV